MPSRPKATVPTGFAPLALLPSISQMPGCGRALPKACRSRLLSSQGLLPYISTLLVSLLLCRHSDDTEVIPDTEVVPDSDVEVVADLPAVDRVFKIAANDSVDDDLVVGHVALCYLHCCVCSNTLAMSLFGQC